VVSSVGRASRLHRPRSKQSNTL